jgi:hypothetical protein
MVITIFVFFLTIFQYTIFARGQCCPKLGTYGIYDLGPVEFTSTNVIQYYSQPCLKYIMEGVTEPVANSYYSKNLQFVTEGECVSIDGHQTSVWLRSKEGYLLPIGITFSNGKMIKEECYYGHLR